MLPKANFEIAIAPDIVIIFGGYKHFDVDAINCRVMATTGFQYKMVASLDMFGRD